MTRATAVGILMVTLVSVPRAQAPVEELDYEMIGKIRDEELNRSQVSPDAATQRRIGSLDGKTPAKRTLVN